MIQCHFHKDLQESLKKLYVICFFVKSGMPSTIRQQIIDLVLNNIKWHMDKVHWMVWESLMDFGKIEWHEMLQELAIALEVAIDNTLMAFDFSLCAPKKIYVYI